jgi:DNA-directed RNA polymerase subunit M/transcription elongation factor TFIIS
MNFCPITYMLLEEITTGNKLQFKSPKIGTIYDASDKDTLLFSEGLTEQNVRKYKNTLRVSAFNPINPRYLLKDGCTKCKRKIVSFQRLGEEKLVVYVCICGNTWTV